MLICQEGFDTLSISEIVRRYPITTTTSSSMTTGRYSGQAVNLNADTASIFIPLPTTYTELYFGMDCQVGSYSSTFFNISSAGGSTIATIAPQTSGTLDTTWGNSSAGVLTTSTWFSLQCHVVINSSTGSFIAKIDGNTVINLTGINTGSTPIGGFTMVGGNARNHYFDNFWAFDTSGSHSNTFPTGAMQVYTLYPSSAGTNTNWTPLSGANYAQVNEAQSDDDTSYVSATTTNTKDSYYYSSLSGSIAQVHGVQISATNKKDSSGGSKTLHTLVISGSTTSESPDIAVPTNYTSSVYLLPNDPNTSAQWTETAVNAIQGGIKVIA